MLEMLLKDILAIKRYYYLTLGLFMEIFPRLEVGSMGILEKLELARARLWKHELGSGSKKLGSFHL